MIWWIEVKIKPVETDVCIYKMFPQVGDIQNNRKHLIDKFLVLLHLWSVYNGNDTQTMATRRSHCILSYDQPRPSSHLFFL